MNLGVTASPIRGGQSTLQIAVDPARKAEASRLSELRGIEQKDIDQYLGALQKVQGKGGGVPGSLARIRPPPNPRSPDAGAAVSPASDLIQTQIASAGRELSQLYGDGLVHERELLALCSVQDSLREIAAMKDDRALAMLPRDVRQRLDAALFGPLEKLSAAVALGRLELFDKIQARDASALAERLAEPVVYRHAELAAPRPSDRYQAGDRIVLGRSSGEATLGVVVGSDEKGIQVAVRTASGGVGLRSLTDEQVLRRNPLKIGDYLPSFEGREVWVSGLGQSGRLEGVARDAQGRLTALSADELAAIALRASALVNAAPAIGPRAKAVTNGVVVMAGGAETTGWIETMRGRTASGGLYTTRGPNEAEHGVNYKDYNEDAAILGVFPAKTGKSEVVVAGAFDQAGGVGQIEGHTGIASQVAALKMRHAGQVIHEGADPKSALIAAVNAAHFELQQVNAKHGAKTVTTIASGAIKDGHAHAVVTGDSKIWHFSKDGLLKNETASHNLGDQLAAQSGNPNDGLPFSNVLTSSIGDTKPAKVDYYLWKMEPGDHLVFASDGVADANLAAQKKAFQAGDPWKRAGGELTARHVGGIVAKAGSAEAATEAVRDYALDQMKNGRAKPDNVAVVVVRYDG